MNMLAKKAKKGFTIVELVIVIAVIAILAAVLIPTFTSVINNANESAVMQESKNEWTNYLSTIAGEGTYTKNTYYVTYDSDYDGTGTYAADYYFVVLNGSFDTTVYDNTDTSYKKDFTQTTIYAEDSEYTVSNEKINIYKVTDAAAAVETAGAAYQAADSTDYSASTTYYVTSVYDSTTYYYTYKAGEIKEESSFTGSGTAAYTSTDSAVSFYTAKS